MQVRSGAASPVDMLNNSYQYDFVGNITQIANAAPSVGALGAAYQLDHRYDDLNRLVWSSGRASSIGARYELGNDVNGMVYDNMHRIVSKKQQFANAATQDSYFNQYNYGNQTQARPHAVKEIKNLNLAPGSDVTDRFTYDLNGNTTFHERLNSPGQQNKSFIWDEANRLKFALIANSSLDHYIYNASGERVLKAPMNITMVSVNGNPPTPHATLRGYTTYVSGYYVVNMHDKASKHYYAGTERIASRLAGNAVTDPVIIGSPGELNILLKVHESELNQNTIQMGVTLGMGAPTFSYPSNCAGLTGEQLKQCQCDLNNQCTQLMYYFHPDHVGSSTYLSDFNGQPYQFLLYLPFGETFVEQNVAGWATPYQFNGKEEDENTGLYYYGARYYDPRISLWHGVDPLAEMYPDWSTYAYTMNNPITYWDPTGMSTQEGGEGDPPSKEFSIWDFWAMALAHFIVATEEFGSKLNENRGIDNSNSENNAVTGTQELMSSGIDLVTMGMVTNTSGGKQSSQSKYTGSPQTTKNNVIITAANLKANKKFPATVAGATLPNGDSAISVSKDVPYVIAPELRKIAVKFGLGTVRNNNTVGCCSEFQAANSVLLRNPEYKVSDVIITPAIRPKSGKVIEPCQNCMDIFGLIKK